MTVNGNCYKALILFSVLTAVLFTYSTNAFNVGKCIKWILH